MDDADAARPYERALPDIDETDFELSSSDDTISSPASRQDELPGGIDHTTAAVGGGATGLAVLGIARFLERRRSRRRLDALDEERHEERNE